MAMDIGWNKASYIVTVLFAWVSSLTVFAFVIIGLSDHSNSTGIFNGTVAYLYEDPKLYINIPKWSVATSIGFCYFDQFVFLLYSTSTLVRKSPRGTPLYQLDPFLHPLLFGTFFAGLLLRLINLFLISQGNLIGGLVCQYICLITLYLTLIISIHGTHKHVEGLQKKGFPTEGKNLVGLVHNSLATYPGWELIFCNARLAEVLLKVSSVSNYTASAVGLGLLGGQFVLLAILELSVLEKYVRFIFSAPLIYIFVLMSMVIENSQAPQAIYGGTIALFVATIVFFVVKLIMGIVREKRKPTFTPEITRSSPTVSYGSGGMTST